MKKVFPFFISVLCCQYSVGQQLPSFKLLRFDEDYSVLKNDSLRQHLYQKLKYCPLLNKKSHLSFGGEARFEYDYFKDEDWGKNNLGDNSFLLQRYDLYMDVHIGNQFRIFSQLRSALQNGRKDGSRIIDRDDLNLHQLFLDYSFLEENNGQLIFRAGRQELNYGSQRLISVREGPNVRLSFDGVKLIYQRKAVNIDAFVVSDIKINEGVFDNESLKQANLWGLYSSFKISPKIKSKIDLYYIGRRKDNAVFEDGKAKEIRHSAGIRYWNNDSPFFYDWEAVLQWGSFGSSDILAWTASSSIGYNIHKGRQSITTLGLKTDVISGDNKLNDGKLGSFNPLYPKAGYFGFDPQIGAVNLIDVHPYILLQVTDKFTIQFDFVANWRYSLHDGVYRPSGSFKQPGNGSDKRYIGSNYLADLSYEFSKFINAEVQFQYFNTGAFLTETGNNKNAIFLNTRIGFKF